VEIERDAEALEHRQADHARDLRFLGVDLVAVGVQRRHRRRHVGEHVRAQLEAVDDGVARPDAHAVPREAALAGHDLGVRVARRRRVEQQLGRAGIDGHEHALAPERHLHERHREGAAEQQRHVIGSGGRRRRPELREPLEHLAPAGLVLLLGVGGGGGPVVAAQREHVEVVRRALRRAGSHEQALRLVVARAEERDAAESRECARVGGCELRRASVRPAGLGQARHPEERVTQRVERRRIAGARQRVARGVAQVELRLAPALVGRAQHRVRGGRGEQQEQRGGERAGAAAHDARKRRVVRSSTSAPIRNASSSTSKRGWWWS